MTSKFFFKLYIAIPVSAIMTDIIVYNMFHIRCIPIHKLLYFSFLSASLCIIFLSAGIDTFINVDVSSFSFLINASGQFA